MYYIAPTYTRGFSFVSAVLVIEIGMSAASSGCLSHFLWVLVSIRRSAAIVHQFFRSNWLQISDKKFSDTTSHSKLRVGTQPPFQPQ
jgi:hypothetical protein